MNQNCQEERDRLRAEHDYPINLEAESEIRNLHEKMDHLLLRPWQKLMEIHQIRMDLMEEFAGKTSECGKNALTCPRLPGPAAEGGWEVPNRLDWLAAWPAIQSDATGFCGRARPR